MLPKGNPIRAKKLHLEGRFLPRRTLPKRRDCSCLECQAFGTAIATIQVLAANDLRALDAAGGVARIYYQLRLLHNAAIVVVGMIRHN